MEAEQSNATISDSREESLQKALALYESGSPEPKPLVRPTVSTGRVLTAFVLWLVGYGVAVTVGAGIAAYFRLPGWVSFLWAAGVLIVLLAIKGKRFIRFGVLLYQKYAPEKWRRACLFTPSCSEYMLLAVDKYGWLKGGCKGIGRLCRCHYPNGGEDLP